MKIKRKRNKIIIKYPASKKRINPYMEGQDVGEYPTFTGLVDRESQEWGLAYTIDMDYKDKAEQFTCIKIDCTELSEEKFIKLCKKLKIGVAYI